MAINTAAKIKNFQTVQDFANRLIDTNPPKALVDHVCTFFSFLGLTLFQAEKALNIANSKGGMNQTEMNYDPRNPFVLCCQTLTPIYQGSASVKCAFCRASYQPKFEGSTCVVCNLAQVGKRVSGLQCVQKDTKAASRTKESNARDSDGW